MISHKHISQKGFTIVEILVAVAVIGILATLSVSTFERQKLQADDNSTKSDLKRIGASMMGEATNSAGFTQLTQDQMRVSDGVTLSYKYVTASEFCIDGKHSNSSATAFYIDQTGIEPKSGSCPSAPSGGMASTGGGTGSGGSSTSTAPTTSPGGVSISNNSSNGVATVKVTFGTVSGADSYDIRLRIYEPSTADPTKKGTMISDGSNSPVNVTSPTNTYTYNSPFNCNFYEYSVRALNGGGAGPWSTSTGTARFKTSNC